MAVVQLDALPVYPCTKTTGVLVAATAWGATPVTAAAPMAMAARMPSTRRMIPPSRGVGTHPECSAKRAETSVESPVLVRLWCLRHAESENVTAGVAGAVPAAALTAAGRTQAAAAARELAPVAVAYASTALRARETAAHLSRTVVTVPELVEVGIGALEGATGPAVFAEWAAVLRTWLVDEDLSRRLAVGESGHEVVARVGVAFARIAAAHPGE